MSWPVVFARAEPFGAAGVASKSGADFLAWS